MELRLERPFSYNASAGVPGGVFAYNASLPGAGAQRRDRHLGRLFSHRKTPSIIPSPPIA